jgi:hypothetical protein
MTNLTLKRHIRSLMERGASIDRYVSLGDRKVACTACGAVGKQPLLLKHKPDCDLEAYQESRTALGKFLEKSGKRKQQGPKP